VRRKGARRKAEVTAIKTNFVALIIALITPSRTSPTVDLK
jgi:hypothetical protein